MWTFSDAQLSGYDDPLLMDIEQGIHQPAFPACAVAEYSPHSPQLRLEFLNRN